jgi:phage/plasmid-associated DNA primase
MEYMATIRERLFTQALGDDVGDYVIRNLARGFAGDTMKRIMFGLGMTNAGKGMLTKACQVSMGAYCGTFAAENLAFNNNSADEAQKLRWAYLLRHKRLIFSNEVSNRGTLNGELIKKISSGGVDRLTARLHGGNETSFIPQYLCFVLANDMQKIEPMDLPMQNRARVYTYTKSFVDEPSNEFELKSDPNLTREMETLRFQRCFIGLLLQSYMHFVEAGRTEEEPAEVMGAIKDWIGSKEDNDIMTIFQDSYELTNDPDDYIRGDELEAWATKGKQTSYKKFCIELRRHATLEGLEFVENKNKKMAKKVFKIWTGIRAISDEVYAEA